VIVECVSCRRGHDLTGCPAGTTTTCRCGAIIAVLGRGDAAIPCPSCGIAVAPSLGQCPHCTELLFTTACSGCGERHFHGHRYCGRCGAPLAPPPARAASPDLWAEGTPLPDPGRTRLPRASSPVWRIEPALDDGTPAERRSRGACPRCRVPLAQRAASRLDLDVCRVCSGVFVEASVLTELLLDGDLDRAIALQALGEGPPPAAAPPAALTCPCCAEVMLERPLGNHAGARVAVCRLHGVWIDRGRMAAVVQVLTVRALSRAAQLERAAFADHIANRRYQALFAHACELKARGVALDRTPMGLLAQIFG
jgi:Zn-finger nucleic acid-binding protein